LYLKSEVEAYYHCLFKTSFSRGEREMVLNTIE